MPHVSNVLRPFAGLSDSQLLASDWNRVGQAFYSAMSGSSRRPTMTRKQRRENLQQDKQQQPPVRKPIVDATTGLMPFALSMQVNQSSFFVHGSLPAARGSGQIQSDSARCGGQNCENGRGGSYPSSRDGEERAADTGYRRQGVSSVRAARADLGFGIGTIAILGAVYAGVHSAQVVGSFIGTAGVTGLVSVFILGRRSLAKQKEIEFQHQMEVAKMQDEKQRAMKESVNKATVSTVQPAPTTVVPASDSQQRQIVNE